ncbi:kinase phosphorylation domain-containing protein, partial [Protomyces lactucae-debilis]
GTRGGRDRFSWQDVKEDHRHASHYLGASLKAPSGRWAANKDLEWFSKPGTGTAKSADEAGEKQAEARRAEILRIKEAEADAVLRALGKPVPDR